MIKNWYHRDHSLTSQHEQLVADALDKTSVDVGQVGKLIVPIPDGMPLVQCSLYGPAMGDEPIANDHKDVVFEVRNRRPWASKLIVGRTPRNINQIVVIALREADGWQVFTAYGGPCVSPMEIWDRNLPKDDWDAAYVFWSTHALCR